MPIWKPTANRLGVGMSDDTESSTPKAPDEIEPHPVYDAPGCGLASYSCILLIFFLIGFVGITFSTFALVQSAFQRTPYSLVPGNQVKVWRLQPMRDVGLLELTEVPLHYHDESSDGTKACALTAEAVLRIEDEDGWKIPFSAIGSVKQARDGGDLFAKIVTVDEQEFRCYFEPGEGVERFLIYAREGMESAQ